jgi:hypothetical protein
MDSTLTIDHHLKPRCPRDNHVMRFEPAGIRWRNSSGETETQPSYHCHYMGCSVRYDPANGYFTMIEEPDIPFFVEEPATNQVRCPCHGTWLYRENDESTDRFVLRCGVNGCDYTHGDVSGIWLRE